MAISNRRKAITTALSREPERHRANSIGELEGRGDIAVLDDVTERERDIEAPGNGP